MIRQATVSKQLPTLNNIFKPTALTEYSFSERIEKLPWLYILLLLLHQSLNITGGILIRGRGGVVA